MRAPWLSRTKAGGSAASGEAVRPRGKRTSRPATRQILVLFFGGFSDPEKTRSTSATRDRDRLPFPLTPFLTSVRTRDRERVEPAPPPRIPGAELRAGVHVRRVSLGAPRDGVPPRRVPARPRARRVAGGGPPGARPELGEARLGSGEARARARPAGLPAGGEGWRHRARDVPRGGRRGHAALPGWGGPPAAALLIGAAEHQGVLDLDTPLSEYGIAAPPVREYRDIHVIERRRRRRRSRRMCELRWGDEWSRVTARHVLGQATGLGEARAGETFDARVTDEILDVLSQVLRATTGLKPAEWAKEHFTGPLGVPDFFARDVGRRRRRRRRPRVAGGQMATCRDAARFGQLLINRGEWLGEDGTSTRLVRADFVRRVVNPSFPRAARHAGYQTWTHPGKTASGAPRATPFFAEVRHGSRISARPETNATSSPTTLRAPPVWADYASSTRVARVRRRRRRRAFTARFWGRRVLRSPWRSPWAGSASSSWCPPRRAPCWSPWGTPGAATRRGWPGLRELLDGAGARGGARSAAAAARPRAGHDGGLRRGRADAPAVARGRRRRDARRARRAVDGEKAASSVSRLARSASPSPSRARMSEPPRRRRRRRRVRGRRRLRARKGVGDARRRGGRERHARARALPRRGTRTTTSAPAAASDRELPPRDSP